MIVESFGLEFKIRDQYKTDEIVIKEIFEENVYEVDSGRFAEPGVTIDLGANIGAFALLAAINNSEVYAIEPEPNNLKALQDNILLNNLNDYITVVPYGISNFNGTAIINDNGGDSTIKDNETDGTSINIIDLNTLFELYDINKVNVLKIDIEGSEVETILGASKETLNKCKYISIEFDIRSGSELGSMTQKLSETHHVRTMGSWERGGMIWAWLY